MCIDLAVDAFFVTMTRLTEMIGNMYKISSNTKRKLARMKEVTFLKTKTEMGDNKITPSQDMVDTKIFEYQILEYVNRITTTKNGVKAAYSLAWGKYS